MENQYVRAVTRDGHVPARDLVEQVFELADRKWRGIGEIPGSGLVLREEFADFDAERKFGLGDITVDEPAECRAGDVLRGQLKPHQCPAFGTPLHAGASARRADGLLGGRVRGLLQLRPVPCRPTARVE